MKYVTEYKLNSRYVLIMPEIKYHVHLKYLFWGKFPSIVPGITSSCRYRMLTFEPWRRQSIQLCTASKRVLSIREVACLLQTTLDASDIPIYNNYRLAVLGL
jgi:hypothetical protein